MKATLAVSKGMAAMSSSPMVPQPEVGDRRQREKNGVGGQADGLKENRLQLRLATATAQRLSSVGVIGTFRQQWPQSPSLQHRGAWRQTTLHRVQAVPGRPARPLPSGSRLGRPASPSRLGRQHAGSRLRADSVWQPRPIVPHLRRLGEPSRRRPAAFRTQQSRCGPASAQPGLVRRYHPNSDYGHEKIIFQSAKSRKFLV